MSMAMQLPSTAMEMLTWLVRPKRTIRQVLHRPPTPPPSPIVRAFQPVFGGGATDVFVTKINATGTSIAYSSYLGGSSEDVGYGIAVDSSANAYVTGLSYRRISPRLS